MASTSPLLLKLVADVEMALVTKRLFSVLIKGLSSEDLHKCAVWSKMMTLYGYNV